MEACKTVEDTPPVNVLREENICQNLDPQSNSFIQSINQSQFYSFDFCVYCSRQRLILSLQVVHAIHHSLSFFSLNQV